MASAEYCDKLLVQKEIFALMACEMEFHMGADLVTKDGCEWIKPSHAVDGERASIKHTCRNVITNSCLTQSSWTSAIYLRQLLDIFHCPTQTVRDKTVQSDVITTTYINRLRGLRGCVRFTFSLCRSTDVLMCAHVSPVHTFSIKQDSDHFSSLEKNIYFLHDESNVKISNKMICIYFCSIVNHNKSFFPLVLPRMTNPHLKHLMLKFNAQRTLTYLFKLYAVVHNLWGIKVFSLAWWIHTGSIDTDNKKNTKHTTHYTYCLITYQ